MSSAATGGGGGAGGAEEPPPFESIPWETGDDIGFGIARKDTLSSKGSSVFIGYGGFGSTLEAAEAWTAALYAASLHDLGVRYVYAVQGPADVGYLGLEIGNSKIAGALPAELADPSAFVLIAAHSSGTFVAHELLGQLQGGLDPTDATADRVVYFNLDGGASGLAPAIVDRLRKAYFVAAVDGTTGTTSPNWNTMVSLGATYGAKGGYWELDAGAAGCALGGTWCLHMAPITTLPHDPTQATIPADYEDFSGRPVTTAYIEAKAGEAGL